MKKRANKVLNSLLILSLYVLPIMGYAQDDQNPDPFDDMPPDFEAEPPAALIDSFLLYFILFGVLLAFYFLIIRKVNNSTDATQ